MSPKWMFWPKPAVLECNSTEIPYWDAPITNIQPYVYQDHTLTGIDDASFQLWKAHRDNGELWLCNPDTDPVHTQMKFPELREFNRADIRLQQHAAGYVRSPKEWKIEGSNNGTSWTQLFYLDEVWASGSGYQKTFTLTNVSCYQYYKLTIIQRNAPADYVGLEWIRYYKV